MSALTSLGQGGGSASGSRVKATGTVYARPLSDRFADMVNVKDFGSLVVNGDWAPAIQAADDYASIPDADDRVKSVWFPPYVYPASNIRKGRAEWFGSGRYATFIIATEEADDDRYLIASPSWLEAGSQYGDRPTGIYDMTIDAQEARDYAYVLRSYFTKMQGVHIKNAINTDLLISTDAADGTHHSSSGSIGNCTFLACWFGFGSDVTQYNVRQVDNAHVNTDCLIQDSFFSGATVKNCELLHQVAGWGFRDNHLYGAPMNIEATYGAGFRIPDNIFEDDCIFHSTSDTYQPAMIGPGNFFWGDHVSAYFENNGAALDQMVFFNNNYSSLTELRHCYNVASKQLVSKNETFRLADPIKFYSGENPSGSSAGVVHLQNAKFRNVAQTISCAFTGVGSSNAAYPAKPSDLLTNFSYGDVGSLGWHHKNGHVGGFKMVSEFADANNARTLSCVIPAIPNYRGFKVIVDVSQKVNYTGTERTKFHREYLVIRNPSTSFYVITIISEIYTSGEWAVAPALTIPADSNGLCTVTFTGTPATTDGYGPIVMEVKGFLN